MACECHGLLIVNGDRNHPASEVKDLSCDTVITSGPVVQCAYCREREEAAQEAIALITEDGAGLRMGWEEQRVVVAERCREAGWKVKGEDGKVS